MTEVQKKIETFFSQFPGSSYKKGATILSPDETISSVYYLQEGSVKMYSISEDGEEITLHVFQSGSFFPIMLTINNVTNHYYFEADEDSKVYQAPSEKVITFLQSEPEVLFDLASRFAAGINGLLKRIEKYSNTDSGTKMVQLLLYLSKKFGKRNENGVDIELDVRHEDIAHWIGTSRETVSRNLEKMQKQGVIQLHKNRITISNKSILQNSLPK